MTSALRRAALAATLLAFTPPALADNTADEADVAFRLGNGAYARGRYDEALASYFLSNRLVPNANVVFNIARCYEALAQYDEAYRYYNDLSAQKLSSQDRRDVNEALARMRSKVALVRIESPVRADVFIDREDLGSRGLTPQTLALAPGKHTVRLKADGYRPAETTVTLQRGREAQVQLSLEQVLGTVDVSGFPEGAWVREKADGPVKATVPGSLKLPPGRRLLYVGAPGHLTSQVLVEVQEDQRSSITVTLAEQPRPSGKVVVVANRESAQVKVDGKQAGFTPTVLSLDVGVHALEVSYPDLRSYTQTVTVAEDSEQKVLAELRYAPPPVEAASKQLLSLDEAPASTTVISREEIRSFGYTHLVEALASVRGIFTVDDRMYHRIGIRGFAPTGDLNTRVLILWDGHPMNDVWAGQGYAGRDLDVDLSEVERIEIVRGPGSALYGTGAFFAVINVVPRRGLDGGKHVEGVGAVGGLSSWRGRASAAVGDPASNFASLSAAILSAGGAETTDLGTRGLVLGLDAERAQNGSFRARYGDLSVSAFLNRRTKQIPNAPYGTRVGAPGTGVEDTRGFGELRFDRDVGPGNLSVRAYYDHSSYAGHYVYEATTPGDPDELLSDGGGAQWLGSELRYRLPLFAANQLSVGVELQHQLEVWQEIFGPSGKEPLPSQRRTILSAYLEDEWRVLPQLSLSAGFRIDRYSDLSQVPLTPRVAVIAHPYAHGLTKLVVGTAFRAPNVYELYYHDGYIDHRPAGPLAPETTMTFEAEHSHDLNEELRVTVAGYQNRVSNLIETVLDDSLDCMANGAPSPCGVNVNTSDLLLATGAEAELRWQPGPLTFVDLAYSFVAIRGAERFEGAAPAHLFSARAMIPLASSVRLTGQATYQSPRVLPDDGGVLHDQLLVNFGLTGELSSALRYYAGVTNLFDSHPVPTAGSSPSMDAVPTYGRGFLLQLTGSY